MKNKSLSEIFSLLYVLVFAYVVDKIFDTRVEFLRGLIQPFLHGIKIIHGS